MATIKIKGRKEPIHVSDIIARQVKQRKFGDEEKRIAKALPTDLVDLGDEWSGEYGRISEIEFEKPRVYHEAEPDPELTAEEKAQADVVRKETREWLEKKGIINKK